MKETKCPKCRSQKIILIIYGYPTKGTLEKFNRGEIQLGGCCISDKGNPSHYCKNCNYEFGNISFKGDEKKMKEPTKKETPVKKEPGYEKKYSTYSGRISYPAIYSKPLKELAKEKDKTIKALYTIAIREYLLKHNRLPKNNQTEEKKS